MSKKKSQKREEYRILIGPLMKQILDEQKKRIQSVTYDIEPGSYWTAGEIIAKKYLGLV